MSLRNYPIDAFNLEMQLTLTDTSRLVAGHPGLQLVPSAGSVEVGWLPDAQAELRILHVPPLSSAKFTSLPHAACAGFALLPHPARPHKQL